MGQHNTTEPEDFGKLILGEFHQRTAVGTDDSGGLDTPPPAHVRLPVSGMGAGTADGAFGALITVPDSHRVLPMRLALDAPVPGPKRPGPVAHLIAHLLAEDEGVHLKHWRDQWHVWREGRTGGRYQPLAATDNKYAVTDMIRSILEAATYEVETKQGPLPRPWDPTSSSVREVAEALAAFSRPDETMESGTWIGPDAPEREAAIPGREVTCVANGLLWCPPAGAGAAAGSGAGAAERKLLPHTPRFFTTTAVAVAYREDAQCERWMSFLDELWPGDAASQMLLQEWFGYVLGGSTALQKIFVLIGPKRSGKGTVTWVLEELLGGKSQVDRPLLSTIGTQYGLANMLGKRLAVISDGRLDKSQAAIVEKLLMISGEDPVTIERKYMAPIVAQLGARIMIVSNDMPDLRDTTGALASRFVPLPINIQGFLGKEDMTLKRTLGAELEGILRWALEGADRLWANGGRFTIGENVARGMTDAERQGSPLKAFAMDCLEFGEGLQENKDTVYETYLAWCEESGFRFKGKNVFFRELAAAYRGEVELTRLPPSQGRSYVVRGARLT